MRNKKEDYVVFAYIVLVFTICSFISFNVPLDW